MLKAFGAGHTPGFDEPAMLAQVIDMPVAPRFHTPGVVRKARRQPTAPKRAADIQVIPGGKTETSQLSHYHVRNILVKS
jgi:hypothetical protein